MQRTSCRECLEIAGIPTSIPQTNFEEKVCQMFEAIGVAIDKNGIDNCDRLPDKERTIVKFLRCKDCKQVLRSVNTNNIDLPEGTKLFINESLCPYYNGL